MTSPEYPHERTQELDQRAVQHPDTQNAPRLRRPTRLDQHLEAVLSDTGYDLRRKIGSGGMGIVYLAEDGSGNEVALKVLRPEIADDSRARARLGREVRALQKTRSDNIAQVIDAELDSPDAFVVTEFIPGPTLEDAVRAHGSLHLEAVREIGVVLGETLQEIHGQGIVHRDLKPSNIMLRHATAEDLTTFDPDGQRLDPVIIDFGIAQAAEDSRLTSTGLMMGTAAYLDPEVVKTNEAGPAADWWAWAALIAFAASGREPFGTGRADLVFLRADRGDIDSHGLPSELRAWLRDALNPDPAQRSEPSELIDRLARLDFDNDDAYDEHDDLPDAEPHGSGGYGAAVPFVTSDSDDGAGFGHSAEQYSGARGGEELDAYDNPETERLGEHERTTLIPEPFTAHNPPTERLARVEYGETPTRAFEPVRDFSQSPQEHQRMGPRGDHGVSAGSETAVLPVHTNGLSLHGNGYVASPPVHQISPYPGPHSTMQRQQSIPGGMQQPSAPSPHSVMPYGQQAPAGMVPGPYGLMPVQPPLPPHLRPAPKRTLLVTLGSLLLIGLGAIAPLTGLVFFLVLNAFARAWQRSWVSMTRARERGAGDGVTHAGLATLALPRFAWGLIEAVLLALFPVITALIVIIMTDAVLGWALGIFVPLGAYGAFLMVTTVGLCWIGIDGRTTRRGAHRVTDAAAPDFMWTAILGGLVGVLLLAVVITIAARGGVIDYFPYLGQFRFEDIAPWRR